MIKQKRELNSSSDRGKRKILIAAVLVIAALSLVLTGLLFGKSTINCKRAESMLASSRFRDAEALLESCSGDKAEALLQYSRLRMDINSNYASLVGEYNSDLIYTWQAEANELKSKQDILPDSVNEKVTQLSAKLDSITELSEEYDTLQSYISELMEVFEEINRLYTKDSSGKNTVFTVKDEIAKVERYEYLNTLLSDYSAKLPGGEDVYLLSYLIKEATGECADIRDAMDVVKSSGYSETDSVRVSGDAQKTFPGVTNSSGDTVSVADKEQYRQFLTSGIQRALVKTLGEFYEK